MRIGIQGWGSEGDLRPLVALAARLRRGGHAPRLLLTPVDGKDYGPICRALGVPLQVVPEAMAVTVQQLARDATRADPTKFLRAVLDLTFFPYLEAMYAAAVDMCAACDVVVGASASWCVKAATIATGVPFAAIHYYPGVVRSRHAAPPGFPRWRWLNRPAWALLDLLMDMGFRAPAARFFAQKGLPPVRHAIPDALFSDRLNLLAASPAFWPPAPDWGALHQVCGDFVMPEDAEPWDPSAHLRTFLADGPPPALLSLGSMEHMAPARTRDLLVGAARHARVRAIVQTKTSDEEGREGDLYFLPWAPHRRVAPMCSIFVHHGGAGTTHAALRAGRPSVVVPFIFEQKLWARRLREVGAAEPCVPFWKATAEKVGDAIRRAVASESMSRAATALAGAIANEDGTGAAAGCLESLC
jgi:UDP:flavonoid glycosyltransferase YjiC (YdhE family)